MLTPIHLNDKSPFPMSWKTPALFVMACGSVEFET